MSNKKQLTQIEFMADHLLHAKSNKILYKLLRTTIPALIPTVAISPSPPPEKIEPIVVEPIRPESTVPCISGLPLIPDYLISKTKTDPPRGPQPVFGRKVFIIPKKQKTRKIFKRKGRKDSSEQTQKKSSSDQARKKSSSEQIKRKSPDKSGETESAVILRDRSIYGAMIKELEDQLRVANERIKELEEKLIVQVFHED